MKLTTRGFTLVELMIVIAIIGILAAALFPSLTAYLARGRDTSRTAGIKEINTALAGYQLDKTALPGGVAGGVPYAGTCVDSGALNGYIVKFPVDPQATRLNNCGLAGSYGYGTGTDNGGTLSYALSATMENLNGGNTGATVYGNYQGNLSTNIQAIDAFTKGTGSGYVVRN